MRYIHGHTIYTLNFFSFSRWHSATNRNRMCWLRSTSKWFKQHGNICFPRINVQQLLKLSTRVCVYVCCVFFFSSLVHFLQVFSSVIKMSFENLSSTDAYASTTSISTLLYDLTEKTIINNDKEELILATDATNTEPPTIAYEYSKNLAMFLSIYFIPVITVFGSVGNILSVMVFLRTKLKKLSSSYYLAALAIFDTGYLKI